VKLVNYCIENKIFIPYKQYGISVKYIECDSDDGVTSDRMCIFRPIRNKVGNFSIGGYIINPATKTKVRFIFNSNNDILKAG
jgi:hypothetical protein